MFRALALALALSIASCNSNAPSKEDLARQVEIHTDSARAYINMGEYQRAEDQARRGLSLAPDDLDLKLALARSMQMQGTTAKILHAEAIYRELPRNEDFRVCLGFAETLERKGLAFAESAEALRAGERQAPDAETQAVKNDEIAMKSWAESAKLFREGLEMKTGNTELMNGLARVYALMGDNEQALTWCRATLDIVRGDRDFWDKQLERDDLTDNESARFRSALTRLDDLEVAMRLLAANLEVRLENKEAAVVHLGKVIEIQPTLAQAYSLRAGLLMELERYEEVVADIDDFLRRAGLPFDDEKVQRAFQLRTEAEVELAAASAAGG
ncbi:MAG: tetratricopeptide repeat protein [Planctomycetes bacterium]|nr:tetratricopeptide repeat protein [Planctomycetota bacterium]MCB9904213.1 tetratricopeptide repeat protein [Planctomycetota bacterium]